LLLIQTGTFVVFDDPSLGGVAGQGIRMVPGAADKSQFSETSEGFGVAVMHQLHCVVRIDSLFEYQLIMTILAPVENN
jgi:hypothetical protein